MVLHSVFPGGGVYLPASVSPLRGWALPWGGERAGGHWFFPPQNWAARVRVSKGKKLVTYEAAHPPHYIAHRKGWLSQHTSKCPPALVLPP